jgi:hypothetical protein
MYACNALHGGQLISGAPVVVVVVEINAMRL